MTRYINTKTGQYPVHPRVVEKYARRETHPEFIDPRIGKLEPVVEVQKPVVDYRFTVKEGKPELRDNVWIQTWVVEKLSDSDADGILKSSAISVREKRDLLLKGSDWTQLADSPVDSGAWAVYRQLLRDLPNQDGFPFDVTWPVSP